MIVPIWKNEANPLKFKAPIDSGLYLVGSTHFNPHTKEEIYLIKVGTSKNLQRRMNDYKGSNPLMFHIAFLPHKQQTHSEKFYHYWLSMICQGQVEGCAEWFKVSKTNYLLICEKGFNFFETKDLTKLPKYDIIDTETEKETKKEEEIPMKTKDEFIIINSEKYKDVTKRENIYTILGGLAIIGGLSFLLVGAVGTVVLNLLGLA